MNLSKHFTLDELTHSQTAARLGLDNTPPPAVLDALKRTAYSLEYVRALLKVPVLISSGYRSDRVNRAVGGAHKSQHTTGEAADFTAPTFGTAEAVMRAIVDAGTIYYDQIILEYGRWVHISFVMSAGRRQALVIDHDGTRAFT